MFSIDNTEVNLTWCTVEIVNFASGQAITNIVLAALNQETKSITNTQVLLLEPTPLEDIGIRMTSFDFLTSLDVDMFGPGRDIRLDFEINGVMNQPGKGNCAANKQLQTQYNNSPLFFYNPV